MVPSAEAMRAHMVWTVAEKFPSTALAAVATRSPRKALAAAALLCRGRRACCIRPAAGTLRTRHTCSGNSCEWVFIDVHWVDKAKYICRSQLVDLHQQNYRSL